MNLHDHAIDLLNEAKVAKDAKTKVFQLEQIKEIVLHRDQSLLKDILPEILNSFITDDTMSIRRCLVHFTGEAIKKSLALCPDVLLLYEHYTKFGANERVTCQIAIDMRNNYSKLVMYIVRLKSRYQTSTGLAETKKLWTSFKGVVVQLTDTVSSDRDELTRMECLRLIETVVTFGLSAPSETGKVLDPRLLAQKRAKDSSGGGDASSGDIPLDHPLINKVEMEQEAEAQFSKLLLWAGRGGPQGCSFTPNQMSLLGQCIGNIASVRPKYAGKAAAAVAVMLSVTGKGSVCPLMSGTSRENLARSTLRLIRTCSAQLDADGVIPKLQSALAELEKLGYQDAPAGQQRAADTAAGGGKAGGAGASVRIDAMALAAFAGKKRDAAIMLDGDEFGEERQRAIAAVDAAEGSLRDKAHEAGGGIEGAASKLFAGGGPLAAAAGVVGASAVGASGGVAIGAGAAVGGPAVLETELAAEFAVLPDISAGLRLATVVTGGVAGPGGALAAGLTADIVLRPVAPSSDICKQLALNSLQRLLDNFHEMRFCAGHTKAAAAHTKICVRAAVTMSFVDLAEEQPALVSVPLVAALASGPVLGRLAEGVPLEITLPRPIWLLVSFALSSHKDDSNRASAAQRLELVSQLLWDLHARHRVTAELIEAIDADATGAAGGVTQAATVAVAAVAAAEGGWGDDRAALMREKHMLRELYDGIVLVSVGRLLQAAGMRHAAKDLLLELPRVPPQGLRFIKLLMHTGRVKAGAGLAVDGGAGAAGGKVRGVRAEALNLLVQLCFSEDEQAASMALSILLWCSVSEDFETRAKVITSLISDILREDSWVTGSAALFAVQAAMVVVGADSTAARLEERAAEAAAAKAAKAKRSSAKAVKVSQGGEGSGSGDGDDCVAAIEGVESGGAQGGGAMELEGGAGAYDEEGGEGYGEGEGEEAGGEEEYTGDDGVSVADVTLAAAFARFDLGKSFQGTFMTPPPGPVAKVEAHAKRHFQLLTQLCILHPPLIAVYFDLYAVALAAEKREREQQLGSASAGGGGGGGGSGAVKAVTADSSSSFESTASTSTADSAVAETTTATATVATATTATTATTPGVAGGAGAGSGSGATGPAASAEEERKAAVLARLIRGELLAIIPVVASTAGYSSAAALGGPPDGSGAWPDGPSSSSLEDLFNSFVATDMPLAQPLLELALDCLHTDIHMPASKSMIALVRTYIRDHMQEQSSSPGGKFSDEEMKEGGLATSSAAAATIAAGSDGNDAPAADKADGDSAMVVTGGAVGAEVEDEDGMAIDYSNDASVRLLVPLLGGMSGAQVELLLPHLVRCFKADLGLEGGLRKAFSRVLQARPPPISRASLLVGLHRMNFKAYGLDQKTLMDAIGMCLNCKEEFPSEVLRETISRLLQDEVPAAGLMRTAILSYSQAGHNDMRKFVMAEVVPQLTHKRTWEIAPKVWDGVAHVMNKLAAHKDAEPMLRCLLGLPAQQIKAILHSGTQGKTPLAKTPISTLLATPLAKAAGKLLKTLSPAEKEEALSGRWAKIEPAAGAAGDGSAAAKAEAEKAELIKELQLTADKK